MSHFAADRFAWRSNRARAREAGSLHGNAQTAPDTGALSGREAPGSPLSRAPATFPTANGAYPIRDRRELTTALQLRLAQTTAEGHVWCAYGRGPQIWLFTCHMSLELSRERGATAIWVQLYGEEAEVKDAGAWRFDPQGNWTRC